MQTQIGALYCFTIELQTTRRNIISHKFNTCTAGDITDPSMPFPPYAPVIILGDENVSETSNRDCNSAAARLAVRGLTFWSVFLKNVGKIQRQASRSGA